MTNLRHSVPTAIFEDACIATTQVIGGDKNISVVFRGDQAYTDHKMVVLPALPSTMRLDIDQQQIGAGYVDHETAHIRYTDRKAWEEAIKANPDPLFGAILNCLEDPRVETCMIRDYPGTRHHLACCSDAVAQDFINNFPTMMQNGQATLRGMGPYTISLGGSLRNGAGGYATATAWGLVHQEIRDWADGCLDKLAKCKNTKQTAKLAQEIYDQIKDPNVFTLPRKPLNGAGAETGVSSGDGKGEKQKGKGKGKGEAEAKKEDADGSGDTGSNASDQGEGGGKKGGDDQAGNAPAGAGADGSAGDDGGPDVLEVGDGQVNSGGGNGAGGHGPSLPLVSTYVPQKDFAKLLGVTIDPDTFTHYTREHDEVIELRPGVDHPSVMRHHGLHAYNKRVMGARSSVIRRKIERALLSRQLTGWNERQEEGRLDNRRLVRAYIGDRDVYRQRTEVAGFDTAVALMIDRSGSMCGPKAELAAEAAINLCLAVEQAGIACEVTGFQDGERHFEYDGMADRIHAVDLVVFKPFDLPTARCREALGAASFAVSSSTPDGMATMMAYQRLRKRQEKRKVLITLTDGAPATAYGRPNAEARHMQYVRDVVAWIQSEGTQVVGIGIFDDSVSRFYDKYVVIRNADDLAGEPMTQLAKILLGERFDPSSNLIKQNNKPGDRRRA